MAGRKEYELLFKLQASLGGKFNSTFTSAVKQTKQLQNTLQTLNSVQKKVDGFQKQESALSSNKEKLAALQEEHKRLQKQMSATEKPSDSLKDKLEKNAQQIEQTTSKIKEQEAHLVKLGDELRGAGINTDNLEQSNKKLASSYKAVQRSQEKIAKISAAQQKNAQAITETKRELGKTIGIITAVGAAIYAGPVKTAAEFEAQMSKVEAISGATAEQMAQITAEAKRMGRTTKFTAVESGQALEYMAMAGWDSEQMLGGLEGVMMLAAASGEDLGLVSDIVTDALTAFSMDAEDAAHFADVLAAAATGANTNVGMMGESFKYAAPLAGAFGFSVEDTAILLGLMANSGIKASQGGTQLRKLFSALSNDLKIAQTDGSEFIVETTKMDGSMRDLKDIIDDVRLAFNGMSEAEIAAAQSGLTEAAQSLAIDLAHENGELKTQAELYDEVSEAVEGLTAAGKVQEAEAISGKTAMAGLLAIVNASEADYNKLTEAIYNADGAAEQMAAIMMDNLEGDITLAKSAFEGLNIALGDALLPTIREVVQRIGDIISRMAEFAEANPELTRQIVKVAGALAGLKVASLTAKLGYHELYGVGLNVQKVFALFQGNIAKAGADAAMGGGKIASMGKTLSGYFGGVKDSLGGLGGSVSDLTGGKLGSLFTKIGGGLQTGILKPLGGIPGKIGGIAGKIAAPFAKVGSSIANGPLGTIAGRVGGVLKNLGGVVTSVLGGPLKGLGKLFGGLFGKAMPLIMIISPLSMLFLNLSGEDISGFIEPLKQAFEDAKPVLQALMEQFQELGKQLLPMLIDTAKKLAPLLGQIVAGLLPVLLEIISAVVPIILELVSQLLPVILDIIGQLAPLLTDIITQILPIVVDLLQMLLPIISELITAVLPVIVDVLNAILPLIIQLIEAALPVLMSLLQALMPVIEVLADLFSSVLGSAIESLKPILDGLVQILTGIIDFVTGVFTGNWEQAWEGVKNIFGGVFNALVELFKAPFRIIVSGINSLIGGLNKLKIPDWVPGIGGKGFNIPEIPMFAKGTPRTPDTFIAGEDGAELVTNAKNRTVFTAAQTQKILANVEAAQHAQQGQEYVIVMAPALQALLSSVQASVPAGASIPQGQATAPASVPTVTAPTVSAAAFGYGGKREYIIKVENNPTLIVENGDPAELQSILEENNAKLKREIEEQKRQAEEDERRGEFE